MMGAYCRDEKPATSPGLSRSRGRTSGEEDQPVSVLYVDDEPLLFEPTRISLEKKGSFTVDTAESAQEALEKIRIRTFDVIVSDYQMPDINGIRFVKKLRDAGNTIPFIIFTGKGREEAVIDAYNAGADFYLPKGGNPRGDVPGSAEKIRQIVNRRRAEDALRESEELFRALFENADDAIFLHEMLPDFSPGRYIMVNDIACSRLGYSREELLSKSPFDIVSPVHIPKIPTIARTINSGGMQPSTQFTGGRTGQSFR